MNQEDKDQIVTKLIRLSRNETEDIESWTPFKKFWNTKEDLRRLTRAEVYTELADIFQSLRTD